MGRTYLSIKLAAAFGLVVGLAVALAGAVAGPAPADAAVSVEAVVAPLVDAEAEQVACMWRSCPALMPHPLLRHPRLRATAPADAPEALTKPERAT